MSVALIIIAHAPLGTAVLNVATGTLGQLPLPCAVLDIEPDCDPDEQRRYASELAARLDVGDGVLVLTDLYGSTPSNIASSLLLQQKRRVVSGLSLPMLIRTMNYGDLDLDALTDKAVSGGRDGVVVMQPPPGEGHLRHA